MASRGNVAGFGQSRVRSTRIEAELLCRLPGGNWPKDPEILRAGDDLTLTSIGLGVALNVFYQTASLRA